MAPQPLLEAYTDVLRACNTVAFEANAAYGMEYATPDHARQIGIVLEKVDEMYRASDRATLFGPHSILQPLNDLVVFCGTEIGGRSVKREKPSESEWREIRIERYTQLYGKFRIEARNDLGVNPPLHTAEEWRRIIKPLKAQRAE